jgi:4-hydroxybenzoate polyprenyltransferase
MMYAGGFFWTLGYDTIYAHQDKSDDVIIGVKSTALKFGAHSKPWISSFYAISLSLICISGSIVDLAWPFYVGITTCALQLAWQVKTLDIDDPKNCLKRFKSNRDFGLILFASIIAAHLI